MYLDQIISVTTHKTVKLTYLIVMYLQQIQGVNKELHQATLLCNILRPQINKQTNKYVS